MPSKSTKTSRSSRSRRRSVQSPAQQSVPQSTHAPAPASPAPPAAVRRPGVAVPNAADTVFTEQMVAEVRYIRSDLLRLLITMAVVVAFMVLAELFIL